MRQRKTEDSKRIESKIDIEAIKTVLLQVEMEREQQREKEENGSYENERSEERVSVEETDR